MSQLVKWLFDTNAFRVCSDNKPFWYTSGTIGPYYINTHFLYGNEKLANQLLETVDNALSDKDSCSNVVLEKVMDNYNNNKIFRDTIDTVCEFIKNNIEDFDYISGGERRDWFFSLPIAKLLGKKHITIFKDMHAKLFDTSNLTSSDIINIDGAKVLHIADLITEASSYERAWIPAIKSIGGEMLWSVVIVDRMQGGAQLLEKHNIKSYAMASIDSSLFEAAKQQNLVNSSQYKMLCDFLQDPNASMREFMIEHPEFLENALKSDEKTIARAKLCLEKDFYKL